MFVGATVPHTRTRARRGWRGAPRCSVQWTSSDPERRVGEPVRRDDRCAAGARHGACGGGIYPPSGNTSVEANPVKSLTLSITADQVKTGDVVEVSAMAFDGNGYKVPNVPFLYTFTAAVEDSAVGQFAPAELDQKGRFVAQIAGDYQIIAVAPGSSRTARFAFPTATSPKRRGSSRALRCRIAGLGHVRVARSGRSRLRDSCGGHARTAHIRTRSRTAASGHSTRRVVDAKAVTDCAVDGETGIAAVVVMAANGRSSITLFDVNDPRAIKPLGTMDDGLGAVPGSRSTSATCSP